MNRRNRYRGSDVFLLPLALAALIAAGYGLMWIADGAATRAMGY